MFDLIGRVSDHDPKNILLIGVDPPVETCLLSLFSTTSYHALIDATYFAAFTHYRAGFEPVKIKCKQTFNLQYNIMQCI